jgi:hypothetical protein
MLEILINDIEIGAQYGDAIYDYWISGSLNNKQNIQIFDSKPIDLRKFKGQCVLCLIELYGIVQVESDFIELEYLGLNKQFFLDNLNIDVGIFHEFKNSTGVYFAKEHEVTNIILEIGKSYSFKIDRFDLVAFASIE